MDLTEIINEGLIILDLDVKTKRQAIDFLTDTLQVAGRIDSRENFLASVYQREKTEPTDMGIGVAIPHGKSDAVIKPSVVIAKLKSPIFWKEDTQPDDVPVYAIFLMASPDQADGYLHLEVISKIASLLIDDDFIEILKTTEDKNHLLNTIRKMTGEN